MADFSEFLSQDSQDCSLLKTCTQTRGNNVPAELSLAKVRTAEFTSSMLYAPALAPESRKHLQSFFPFLAVAPPLNLLLEERGCSRSGKLGWRFKSLQTHWSISLNLSSPLIPITKYCERLRKIERLIVLWSQNAQSSRLGENFSA